jgi:hypothetical protein
MICRCRRAALLRGGGRDDAEATAWRGRRVRPNRNAMSAVV